MNRVLPVVLVLVVLAIGTLVEARLSDRWSAAKSEKLDDFTQRLNSIPKQIGDWVGVDEPINQEEFKASNCTNCVSRTYTNREGQKVNVYLVSGSARHVTIHTPDWCYVGAGYEKVQDPQQYRDDLNKLEPKPEFLTANFRKETPLMKSEIRIFWSFSDDGNWYGPRIPKAAFAGRPALYKIYLITDISEVGAKIETNPSLEFARIFLPTINPILFPPIPQSGSEA
jgi:hypothetical protein